MIRVLAIALPALFLAGCATTYSPKKLTQVAKVDCIHVSADSAWRETRGLFNYVWEEGVSAGYYTAAFEDKDGVFYRGEGRPVWQRWVDAKPLPGQQGREFTHKQGGIWLPKDPSKKPRIYQVFEAYPGSANDANQAASAIASQPAYQGAGPVGSSVGGAIGGALVNAMIRSGEGKFVFFPDIKDETLLGRIGNVVACPAAPTS